MTTETLTVSPSTFDLTQIFNDESFRDANGGVWTRGRNGNRWQMSLVWQNLQGADRRAVWAHIAQLRGQQNRLRVNLSTLDYARTGNGGGTPLLNGAHSAGDTTLTIDGATSIADWLVGGDFIAVGNELKMVTQSVTTTGGAGTIPIWPELHQDYADNTAVEVAATSVRFVGFLTDAQGIGSVPFPNEWLSPSINLVLEEDVSA